MFHPHRRAVLTIFHDGVRVETVELEKIGTSDEMHQMMVDKGFELKHPLEVARIKRRRESLRENDRAYRKRREERRMKEAKPSEQSLGKEL